MKVVRLSASRTGRLCPQEMFLILIFTRGLVDLRAIVRSEGIRMSLKNPVTPPWIDHGTVRLVAQRLNHYSTPGPISQKIYIKKLMCIQNLNTTYKGHDLCIIILITIIIKLFPRTRIIFDELMGPQLVKKFPSFYGRRTPLTAYARPRSLSLSRAISVPAPSDMSPFHSMGFSSILIVSPL